MTAPVLLPRNAAMAYWIAVLAMLFAVDAAAQEGTRDYVEVAYSLYNPDWERRENASGASLLASRRLGDRFRATASVNLLETGDTGLDVVNARGLPFSNWHTVGLGVYGPLGSRFGYTVTGTYQGVDVDDNYESGAGIAGGLYAVFGSVFGRELELGLEVGFIDVVISDTTLVGQVVYRLSGSTALTARIMDYADWDYTRYELGLRATF